MPGPKRLTLGPFNCDLRLLDIHVLKATYLYLLLKAGEQDAGLAVILGP